MADFSKNRVLALYNILQQHTDEAHQLSMQEILTLMEHSGHSCSEDSILRYVKQLRTEMGVDIISSRGRNARYYIGSRLLEKEELKLLIDSINASNFIEKSVATKMIDKLKGTTSIYEGAELDRTVLGITVAKTENRKILYNVNLIQEALSKKVQINFDSMRWNEKKELVKSNSHRQRMYPWALLWANDRYYLYGYDIVERDGKYKERHYRVDKLANIELTDIPRKGEKQFQSFQADTYVVRRMGMFAGEEHLITVKAPEYLVGAFIDQYGKRIVITGEEEGKVLIKFTAVPSPILLGWLVGLRNVEVLEPASVREDMIQMLKNNMACYEE
jgi:predicted DNA-binding transcriptional regulator YafY